MKRMFFIGLQRPNFSHGRHIPNVRAPSNRAKLYGHRGTHDCGDTNGKARCTASTGSGDMCEEMAHHGRGGNVPEYRTSHSVVLGTRRKGQIVFAIRNTAPDKALL